MAQGRVRWDLPGLLWAGGPRTTRWRNSRAIPGPGHRNAPENSCSCPEKSNNGCVQRFYSFFRVKIVYHFRSWKHGNNMDVIVSIHKRLPWIASLEIPRNCIISQWKILLFMPQNFPSHLWSLVKNKGTTIEKVKKMQSFSMVYSISSMSHSFVRSSSVEKPWDKPRWSLGLSWFFIF